MNYFTNIYPKLYYITLNGWWLYCVVLLVMWLCWNDVFKKSKPHNATMKYYTILLFIALFIIGVLLSIFLPTPSYFGV